MRPVNRGMRLLLYVLTALTFIAGTQLFVLSEHTDGGDVDFAEPSAAVLVAYLLAVLVTGGYGALLSLREGRCAPTGVRGGIPVEVRTAAGAPRFEIVPIAGDGAKMPA
jgi:hypothetical protein